MGSSGGLSRCLCLCLCLSVCVSLQEGATLYALWPDGTCERMGLSGQYNTSLTDMIGAAVNASNSPAVAAAINTQLASLSAQMTGGSGGGSDQMTQQVGWVLMMRV